MRVASEAVLSTCEPLPSQNAHFDYKNQTPLSKTIEETKSFWSSGGKSILCSWFVRTTDLYEIWISTSDNLIENMIETRDTVRNTTGKQLSSGVTRFDVNWFVNWFVSLVVYMSIYTMSHVTFPTRTLCANLSQSNATTGCLYLYKMPPLFFYYTWQSNLSRQSGLSNHLDQSSKIRSASHHNDGYKWGTVL